MGAELLNVSIACSSDEVAVKSFPSQTDQLVARTLSKGCWQLARQLEKCLSPPRKASERVDTRQDRDAGRCLVF